MLAGRNHCETVLPGRFAGTNRWRVAFSLVEECGTTSSSPFPRNKRASRPWPGFRSARQFVPDAGFVLEKLP